MAFDGMDGFCGSPFWDLNLTWHTDDPDLTPCFEKTVLIWIPCIFLWVFTPLEIFYLLKSRCKNIPWNYLNISKMVLTVILVLISLADVSYALFYKSAPVYTVDYFSPAFKLLTFALAATLIHFNRIQGMQTSGLLWQFFFYLTILGVVQMRTEFREFFINDNPEASNYNYYSYTIYYIAVVLLWILNCFADAEPSFSNYERTEKLYPEIRSSFLSRLLFAWFDPLAWKGYRQPLEVKDLWDMNPEDACKEVAPRFINSWEKAVKKANERHVASTKKSEPRRSRELPVRRKRRKTVATAPAPAPTRRRWFMGRSSVRPANTPFAIRPPLVPLRVKPVARKRTKAVRKFAWPKPNPISGPSSVEKNVRPISLDSKSNPGPSSVDKKARPSGPGPGPGQGPYVVCQSPEIVRRKNRRSSSPPPVRRPHPHSHSLPSPDSLKMFSSASITPGTPILSVPKSVDDSNEREPFKPLTEKSGQHRRPKRQQSETQKVLVVLGRRRKTVPENKPRSQKRSSVSRSWSSFEMSTSSKPSDPFQGDAQLADYATPDNEPVTKASASAAGRSGKASFRKASGSVEINSDKQAKHEASILPILFKVFGPTFAFGSLLKLINDLMTFVSPQLLKLLIEFVNNRVHDWQGYLYATAMLLTAMIQTVILAQYFNRMFLVGIRIRTALIAAIYRKALRMSNAARKESTVGEIVNLMSVDAQRFMDLTAYLNMIWSAPLQIALALYFLWDALGVSVLSGLAVMIFMIPVNGVIANKVKSLQITQMKYKDERVKLMNEVLSGIKVLKLYAWEPSFEEQILRIRNKEIAVLKTAAYLNAATAFIWACAPFLVSMLSFLTFVMLNDANSLTAERVFVSITLFEIMRVPLGLLPIVLVYTMEVSLASFATFVLVDENNILDAKTAFFSLSLFNILRFPLSMLPMMISNMVQTAVSVKRINKFMNCEELNPDDVTHDAKEADPLLIENGNFSWGSDEAPVLKNININVKKGALVAVVGTVGSGKSSLLSAFLGEMDKISGRVNTNGHIAYVPQQAWIQNATLRDNILFGGTDGIAQYNKVVDACALKSDFDMLPAGDQTEIGEKGINLSGGQKQRVSLARAVFCDADIYLLDDPLSAVDSHVGKHIFEKVLGPQGLLKKKTRVLVTHSITYLPEVDNIIVLTNGEVSESGTFKELLKKKGAFAEFLVQHLQEVDVGDSDTDLEEIKAQLESSLVTEEVKRELERHMSRLSEGQDGTPNMQPRRSLSGSSGKLATGSAEQISQRRTSSETKQQDVKTGEKLIEQEKVETGSVKRTVYYHYLRSIGIFLSTATVVLNIIFQGFSVGSSVWLSVWSSDQTYYAPNSTDYAYKRDKYLGVYGALGIGQGLFTVLAETVPRLGCVMAATYMHNTLLNGVMRSPMSFHDVTPLGRVLARFSKDIDILDNVLPQSVVDAIWCAFEVVGTIAVISYSTPIFIFIIIPIAVLYYFVQRFYVATSRQLKRLDSVSRSPIYSHFSESITGAPSIRAYGVSGRFISESETKVDYNQICNYPIMIANRWLAIRLECVGNLIIFFAALFAVVDSTSDPGLVGLSVSYALQITQTLNWLVRMTSEVETNIVAVERIKEYGDTPQEAPWAVTPTVVTSSWPEKGEVEFLDYKVRYRAGLDLVLKGVKFVVKGGEKVGIVGRTGAGKSSLTLGLFRIVEAADGKILIDGVDISKLGLHELRSHLTIIPQDPVLFSGTLRMNLDPFGKYSDTELWQALEHAHLKSFVKELSAGLEFGVTEGGENLSVGQRQLICLARALLRKTRVLVLDEATAAVDLETDDLIQTTIRQEFKECTVLTIAHRLNTVMDSDRVLVLDKGYVVEYEPPQKLLTQKNSVFYGMAKDAGVV